MIGYVQFKLMLDAWEIGTPKRPTKVLLKVFSDTPWVNITSRACKKPL